MQSHKQLVYGKRCKIHALKKTGISQTAMAKIVGMSQPTISRELKRNTGLNGYSHLQAQHLRDQRRSATHSVFKMIPYSMY